MMDIRPSRDTTYCTNVINYIIVIIRLIVIYVILNYKHSYLS